MDFRSRVEIPKRKQKLREELETAMLEYKGKITVLPNNIGMPRPGNKVKDEDDILILRKELAERILKMKYSYKIIASMLSVSIPVINRMVAKSTVVSVLVVKTALKKLRDYERV